MDKQRPKLVRSGKDMLTTKNNTTLNINKLIGNNPNIISSAKSLEDVTPINWSKEVLSGDKKVILDFKK